MADDRLFLWKSDKIQKQIEMSLGTVSWEYVDDADRARLLTIRPSDDPEDSIIFPNYPVVTPPMILIN